MLNKLKAILELITQFSVKKPKLVIATYVVLLIISILSLKDLKVIYVIDDLINNNYETYGSLKTLEEEFHIRNSLFITYRGQELISQKEICAIDHWLEDESLSNQNIQTIFSATRLRKTIFSQVEDRIGLKLIMPNYNCSKELNKIWVPEQSPWEGISYLMDGKDFSFEIQLKDADASNVFGRFDHNVVKNIKDKLKKMKSEKNLSGDFLWSGTGVYQYEMKKGLDIQNALNILVFVIILLSFKYFFGTFKSGFLFLLTIIPSYFFIYSLFSVFNYSVDVLTNSLFIILVISCVEDFFYLSFFWDKEKEIIENFKRIILPSFFTSLTTFIGFASLYFSEIDVISHFGIMTAIAAFIEWLMIFSLLPALICEWPKLQNWTLKKRTLFSSFKISFLKPRRSFSLVLLLFYPLGFWGLQNIKIDDSPEDIFPSDHELVKTTKYLESTRKWKTEISVLFKKPIDKKLKSEVINYVENSSNIVKVENYDEIVDYYIKPVRKDAAAESFVRQLIDSSKDFDRLTNIVYERVNLYINTLSAVDVARLRHGVESLCRSNECALSGSIVSYSEFAKKIPETLNRSLIISIVLVSFVIFSLCFLTNKMKECAAILFSSLWGPAFICFLVAFIELKFNYATCIFASVLVGLAGDNAIQFIFSPHDDILNSVEQCHGPSISVSFFTVLITIPFFLGIFLPMKTLGLLFILGTVSSLFGDVWMLSGFVKAKKPS